MGAIVTWRAEVAASKAAELTQRGVVIAINLGAQQSMDRAQAMGEAADVTRVQQLLDERNLLGDEQSLAPAGPAKAQLSTDYGIAFWVAEWQLRNDWDTAPISQCPRRAELQYRPPHGRPGRGVTYTDQLGGLLQPGQRPAEHSAESPALDIGLVIGLACATVAHQLARRAGCRRPARRREPPFSPSASPPSCSSGCDMEDLRDTVDNLRDAEEVPERTTKMWITLLILVITILGTVAAVMASLADVQAATHNVSNRCRH